VQKFSNNELTIVTDFEESVMYFQW